MLNIKIKFTVALTKITGLKLKPSHNCSAMKITEISFICGENISYLKGWQTRTLIKLEYLKNITHFPFC